ncbi:MAG TPA: hypothetical protein VF407_25395, partial [Polyangiaceae bacterium]
MSNSARIAFLLVVLDAIFAAAAPFLKIDVAYPAAIGILVGLAALFVVPGRLRLVVVILDALVGGYLFFRADSFWGLFTCGVVVLWCLVGLLPIMDAGWRFRTGLAVVTLAGASVILLPTLQSMSGGKIHCPQYIKDRMDFQIAAGLDLRGGLRLVYTVEVEEAIRDKRDHYADEMKLELATIYGFHSGEGLIKHDELEKLESKVKITLPESAVIRLKFKDPADVAKLDERFLKKFSAELAMNPGPATDEATFKIRAEVESQIRERAVSQAKDTVNRRIDGLGLKEAGVTSRDEDIIIEVPGENEADFEKTKETVRLTARLEFKMVDDEKDF